MKTPDDPGSTPGWRIFIKNIYKPKRFIKIMKIWIIIMIIILLVIGVGGFFGINTLKKYNDFKSNLNSKDLEGLGELGTLHPGTNPYSAYNPESRGVSPEIAKYSSQEYIEKITGLMSSCRYQNNLDDCDELIEIYLEMAEVMPTNELKIDIYSRLIELQKQIGYLEEASATQTKLDEIS